MTVYALIIGLPLLLILFGSLKTLQGLFTSPFGPPSEPQVGNYSRVFAGLDLQQALFNSAMVTGSSVFITLFAASATAFAIARLRGWQSNLLYGAFILGMAVPAQTMMIPQYVLWDSLGLLNSRVGLILINVVVTLPIAVFILGGFMRTLPSELFEASAIDGAGPWRMYRSIAVPLSAPSLAATGIFLFVIHWNELLYPLLFIQEPSKRTLPLALLQLQGEFLTDYPLLFAGVIIASAPVVIAYVLLQRQFVAGMTAGALKG